MNTTFSILWFEDEVNWFNMEMLRIDQILQKHSLVPIYTRKDGADFNLSEVEGNDYDLILMDYKLADDETTGDDIISAIREANILTDILFYSSQEKEMLEALRNNMPPIDGVYLTKRDYQIFTEKVEKIIDKIVRRSEDVVNLRGFVLDNTSEFELRIKEILNICWQKFSEDEKAIITETLDKVFANKLSRVNNQIDKSKATADVFVYANNNDYFLGISDRLDIFKAILPILVENYKLPDLKCEPDFKQYYMDRINVYRNKLGHVKLGEKVIHINGKEVEINQDLHRLLRKNIAEIDGLIKSIEDYITTKI